MSKKQAQAKKAISRTSLVVPCVTVFISSFCIMAIELVAGRVMARRLGASLYTWTSVIGVVLAGITLGNYLGGRIADRFQPRKAVSVLFVICSVTCVVTIILNNLAAEWKWLWYLSWSGHVFMHVSLVFLLPSILLGTISPVVAKMALDRGLATGRTIGAVYAWGTAGSIIGTFVAGYYLIAAMGTVAIIWVVGAALLLMAILYWVRLRALYIWAVMFCCAWIVGMSPWQWCQRIGGGLALREPADPAILYEDESQYSYIAVKRVSQIPDKRKFYLDRLTHSDIIMNDILDLQYHYSQIFAAATYRLSRGKDKLSVMVIGGGGYVFPRYIEKVWPGSCVDVVEIDPSVTEAAIRAFGLDRNTPIRTIAMDARNYVDELLKRNQAGSEETLYDFIYEDAINDYSVPFQLITREFNDKIVQLLTDDGVYMVNIVDTFDSGLFLGAFVNTLEKTFPYIYIFTTGRQPSSDRNTFVIIAARGQLDLNDLEKEYKKKKAHLWHLTESDIKEVKEKAEGIFLSDDYAPVENLLAPVVRRSSIDFLVDGYMEHAEQLSQRGRFDQSIAAYRKVLRLKPPLSVKVYNSIAGLLGKQGRLEEQLEALRKAIRYNSEAEFKVPMGGAHYNLAAALRKLGRLQEAARHFDRAAAEFRQESRDDPKSARLLSNLGHALAENGNFEEASKFFGQALALDPTKLSSYANLVMALKMQGRFEEAIKLLRKGHEFMLAHGRRKGAEELQKLSNLFKFEKSKQQ